MTEPGVTPEECCTCAGAVGCRVAQQARPDTLTLELWVASELPEPCRGSVIAACCRIISPDRWNGLEKDRDNSDRLVLRRHKGTEMVPVFVLVETNVSEWLVWP